MSYFYIYCNEDGETRVREMEPEEILSELIDDNDREDPDVEMNQFWTTAPEDSDPCYWKGKRLIIKGEIVTPRPVSVRYELA